MAENSKIEWTGATWNPIGGCTRVDEGCRNCYAEVMAARFSKPGQWGEGLAQIVKSADGRSDHRWTGKVVLHEAALDRPRRWRRPRLIFVNSTSDLFHESVPDEWIDRIFAVMALCPQHTFQVLTKRPDRAREYLTRFAPVIERGARVLTPPIFSGAGRKREIAQGAPTPSYWTRDGKQIRDRDPNSPIFQWERWPLPNVWLGTSISDQASAEARIPELLACPAAIRFVSAEPMLGPIDLINLHPDRSVTIDAINGRSLSIEGDYDEGNPSLDWVICGGESGPGARVWPGFEDAARSLRDQCRAAGVAFFMKQMAGPRKSAMPPIPEDLLVREFPHD